MPVPGNWWEQPRVHTHGFAVPSTIEENHQHLVNGFTKPVNGSSYDRHTHFYNGLTSFEREHYHRYYGETGPAIPLADGSHYHGVSGRVYYNYTSPLPIVFGGVVYSNVERPRHDHKYEGRTGSPLGFYPPNY
ncbi:hypothetical protein GJU40_00675 [Bacillus lacus]|uniref:Uncharacterized protein n=1 Tax=Metabacillus lacus TaxID=1983721 RepID=A0A7X2IVS2_9BACI|nr:YmaF family protein [Metabacillus lacus]MRX70682.1 hypothetical protein [Metabacillus lacus]